MQGAVVVDDEPLPRRAVASRLEEEPNVQVLARCRGGQEAVEAVEEHDPDLLFLDIEMPGMDGFETLRRVRERGHEPAVVFVTAHDEHAVRAFEAHALDYVLKPLDDDRFGETLERAKRQVREEHDAERLSRRLTALLEAEPGSEPTDRIVVRKGDRILFLDPEEVDWVEAADNYVRLHCGEESHLVRKTMAEMEEELPGDRFLRIHRSSIVDLTSVRALERREHGDYDVVLKDGTRRRLSRSRQKELERRLGQQL